MVIPDGAWFMELVFKSHHYTHWSQCFHLFSIKIPILSLYIYYIPMISTLVSHGEGAPAL